MPPKLAGSAATTQEETDLRLRLEQILSSYVSYQPVYAPSTPVVLQQPPDRLANLKKVALALNNELYYYRLTGAPLTNKTFMQQIMMSLASHDSHALLFLKDLMAAKLPPSVEGKEPASVKSEEFASAEGKEPARVKGKEVKGKESASVEGKEVKGKESASVEGKEVKGKESASVEGKEVKGKESASVEGKEVKGKESASVEGEEFGISTLRNFSQHLQQKYVDLHNAYQGLTSQINAIDIGLTLAEFRDALTTVDDQLKTLNQQDYHTVFGTAYVFLLHLIKDAIISKITNYIDRNFNKIPSKHYNEDVLPFLGDLLREHLMLLENLKKAMDHLAEPTSAAAIATQTQITFCLGSAERFFTALSRFYGVANPNPQTLTTKLTTVAHQYRNIIRPSMVMTPLIAPNHMTGMRF